MDICFCNSKECPWYSKCLRGSAERKGIYTVSFLSEVCNETNDYGYYIENTESVLAVTSPKIDELFDVLAEIDSRNSSNNCLFSKYLDYDWSCLCDLGVKLLNEIK